MNAKEIVKALETEVLCESCPHNWSDCPDDGCYYIMAADLIESLQAQLAESQRRERAAVADITHDCDTCLYAGCAWDKPPCETCIEGEFLSGVKRTDNWQWRGPAAGEGDAK